MMIGTAPRIRTEWWDADDKLIRFPATPLAIFSDGPMAGFHHVCCRATDHPPALVLFRARPKRPSALYTRDDKVNRLTYRWAGV